MHYQTFAPPEILKPFIKYFWALESTSIDNTSKTFGAIVDGCPGAIMLRSDNNAFCDEYEKKLPGIFLYGQTIRPIQLSATGNFKAIGIYFQPHALKSVFGLDADDLNDACIDLDLMRNKKQGKLSEQLLNSPSLDDQLKIISFYLIDQFQSNTKKADETTQYALTQIVHTNGNIPLRELQQKLQQSERSLERKFKQTVGISPKLFSQICRFQESLNQMRKSKYDKLSDIAFENDYSDQSHFIRVFKEFTGFSPLEFKKQSSELVENFPQITKLYPNVTVGFVLFLRNRLS
jgi:AraC-like DNA-binding protein